MIGRYDGMTLELCDSCNKSDDPVASGRQDDPTERLLGGTDRPRARRPPSGQNGSPPDRSDAMYSLLLIEDDDSIRMALSLALEDEGYVVHQAADGSSGLAAFGDHDIDLVLLDLRLPDMSGFDVCRALRATSIVPIIIITAQTDTHDMVAGLEAGADDYVTKPVVPKQLAARIRALMRRVHLQEASPMRAVAFGDVELRREQGIVLKGGAEIALTKTEFRLLCEFADHVGAVLSRDQLLERVWGYEYLGDSRLVDAHVRRLRTKIEDHPDDPQLIVTVRGLGYRLVA